jgi:hypothetical protein
MKFDGQKVILVFYKICVENKKLFRGSMGGQKLQFLSCPLAPNLSSTKNNFKIKHSTTEVCSNPYFFSKLNAHV